MITTPAHALFRRMRNVTQFTTARALQRLLQFNFLHFYFPAHAALPKSVPARCVARASVAAPFEWSHAPNNPPKARRAGMPKYIWPEMQQSRGASRQEEGGGSTYQARVLFQLSVPTQTGRVLLQKNPAACCVSSRTNAREGVAGVSCEVAGGACSNTEKM